MNVNNFFTNFKRFLLSKQHINKVTFFKGAIVILLLFAILRSCFKTPESEMSVNLNEDPELESIYEKLGVDSSLQINCLEIEPIKYKDLIKSILEYNEIPSCEIIVHRLEFILDRYAAIQFAESYLININILDTLDIDRYKRDQRYRNMVVPQLITLKE